MGGVMRWGSLACPLPVLSWAAVASAGGGGAGEAGRGVGQVPRAQVFYLPDCDRCCISWAQRHSPGLDGHGLQTQSPRVQGFAGTQDP